MPLDTKEVKLCETEGYLRNNRRVGESDSPATCCHHESSERITKGRNICIKMGDRGRSKSRKERFSNFEALLYCHVYGLIQ